MNPHRQSSAGFSLIEVMCAILILGIGIAGMTHGVATALRSSQQASLETRAALLAVGQIEILRAEGLLSEGTTTGSGPQDLASLHWEQAITKSNPDGLYNITVTVHLTNSTKPICQIQTLLFDPPATSSHSNTNAPSRTSQNANRKRSP
ncbi:MAG: hypothetical protein RI897_3797 [Verrucomicrobiota bacterium]|jgi:prepilin-type N-terminal cleavage/methylation domain-containing protein